MKKLLIASIYGKEAAKDWFGIQQHFIDKHTKDYDFATFLHEVEDESQFSNIIGRAKGNLLYTLPEMFHQVYHYFRQQNYENYLLLDSDCFPIKKDWYSNLLNIMGNAYFASPVRTDNLDITPHPCAIFIKGEHINKHLFYFRRPSVGKMFNLVGEEVIDIGTGFKTRVDDKQVFFPLIRSNFFNVHPILASIYGDTFYHHGAGSRLPWFRSTDYWEKIHPEHYKAGLRAYEFLKNNPNRFVAKLRGKWAIDRLEKFFEKG